TKTSWEAFTAAQTVSEGAKTDLEKANKALADYTKAKNGLVNIEKLSKAMDDFKKAKKYKDKYYTEDSLKAYKALADKMDDYKKLLENGTKEEVKAATEALNGLKLVLMDVEFIDFISRVSGEDRIATSVEISKKYFEKGKVDAVVVARYDEFPDALAASSLAKAYNGPILLTKSNQLDEEVFKEIKRLAPERVFVVGGDKAVSNGVVAQLRKASVFGVDRIAGETRYETSAAVARQVVKKQGHTMKAVIATGENWPDALTASTLAVAKNSPVLLVRSDRVDSAVKEAIKDLKITGVYIIGGTGAISKSVEKALPTVIERLAGEDRYGTAKAVAEYAFPESDHAFLASGESFADAMAIGPVAGSQESPILLSTVKLHKTAEKVLKNGTIDHFTIIGGTVRIATMDLEAEENIRDARSKAGMSITKRYDGKVPTLKEALEGAENRGK
ncbi:MAG: cell wall-binding repeat-containing protein, partial [Firmicutes bacterium]|nr:cell wall-binding repeat-containing protein [Bacillota bacterium]